MLGTEKLVAFGATTDARRAAAFYVECLGLAPVEDTPFALVLSAGGIEVRLQKVSAFTPQPFTVLGWQVRDIDPTVTALSHRGVVFERFPGLEQEPSGVWNAPSRARVAWFKDPDGNLLSISEAAGAMASDR